jgi:methionine aminotransferase
VAQDPASEAITAFYQQKRDRFLRLLSGSRFRPLLSQGTFFQLLDYSTITDEPDRDFAIRLIREHGVAAIPLSPFLHGGESAGQVLRFCFAKQDETLARATERLVRV